MSTVEELAGLTKGHFQKELDKDKNKAKDKAKAKAKPPVQTVACFHSMPCVRATRGITPLAPPPLPGACTPLVRATRGMRAARPSRQCATRGLTPHALPLAPA